MTFPITQNYWQILVREIFYSIKKNDHFINMRDGGETLQSVVSSGNYNFRIFDIGSTNLNYFSNLEAIAIINSVPLGTKVTTDDVGNIYRVSETDNKLRYLKSGNGNRIEFYKAISTQITEPDSYAHYTLG